jgi:Pyruvate/2-oxoacid:ferredoxin oxidoreductase delta subunit
MPSPLQLTGEAERLAGTYENGYVFCSRHAPQKRFRQGIEVPCLGSISWEEWLALLFFSGTIKVFHPAEGCNRCCVETGGEIWREQMRKAESLAEKNMLVCTRLNIEQKKDRPRHINRERRQLFGALVGGLGEVPENFVSGLLGGEQQEQRRITAAEGMITGRRRVLLDLLWKQPELAERIRVKLPRVEGNCRFCEACSILCPQGALKQNRVNGVIRLELDGAVCSGCNLCVEVCYHRVLRLEENKAVELGKSARCLVEGREFTCPDCGGIYTAVVEDGSACCKQRRQWAEMPYVIARAKILG